MLTNTPTLSSRPLANVAASPMPSRSDHNAKQTATPGIPQKSRKVPKAVRGNAKRAQECVRVLRVVQRLLSRDMRRQNLSLRRAARDGRISIGTLSSVLDSRRVADPAKQPKRGVHRGTLLHLRAMPWIRLLTAKTLDRLIAGATHGTK